MLNNTKNRIPFLALGTFDYSILIVKDQIVSFHQCNGAGAYYKDDYRKVIFNITKGILRSKINSDQNYKSLSALATTFHKMHLEIIRENIDLINYNVMQLQDKEKISYRDLVNEKSQMEMELAKDKVESDEHKIIIDYSSLDKSFHGCPSLNFNITINSKTKIVSIENITNVFWHFDQSQDVVIEHQPILLSLEEALIIFSNLYLYQILSDLQYDHHIETEKSDSVGESELIYIMGIGYSPGNLQVNRNVMYNIEYDLSSNSTNLMTDYILQYTRFIRNLLEDNLITPQRLLELGTFNLFYFLQDCKIVEDFFAGIVNFLEEMNSDRISDINEIILYTLLIRGGYYIQSLSQISSNCKIKLNSFIKKYFPNWSFHDASFFSIN